MLLGATAGQAVLGPAFRLGPARGQRLESDLAELVTATSHPSAILRVLDKQGRAQLRDAMIEDLRFVNDWLGR